MLQIKTLGIITQDTSLTLQQVFNSYDRFVYFTISNDGTNTFTTGCDSGCDIQKMAPVLQEQGANILLVLEDGTEIDKISKDESLTTIGNCSWQN